MSQNNLLTMIFNLTNYEKKTAFNNIKGTEFWSCFLNKSMYYLIHYPVEGILLLQSLLHNSSKSSNFAPSCL